MLLTDVFIIEKMEIIQESKGNGTMKVRGIFQRAEEANNNGRIYPSRVLGKQVDKLQDMITERRLCGELDHPQNDSVKLANASHLITKLEVKGNEVHGEAEILNTPAGLTAKALINGGVKIGISSRGMGTLSEDSKGQKVVNEDFNLITFDLVADPSTRGAYPMVSESRTMSFINESKAKLQKESNFYTMLKSRFDEGYKNFISEMEVTSKPSAKKLKSFAKGEIRHSKLASKASKKLKTLNKSAKKQGKKKEPIGAFKKEEGQHSKKAGGIIKLLKKLRKEESKEHKQFKK